MENSQKGRKMKKGFKRGARVTVWAWYMPCRAYGKIMRHFASNYFSVTGNFGLEMFHVSQIRLIK